MPVYNKSQYVNELAQRNCVALRNAVLFNPFITLRILSYLLVKAYICILCLLVIED